MNNSCEITLQDLIKTQYLVKKIKIHNNSQAKLSTANNLTRTMGLGMEYAESRVYQPGDDVRHIDWRLSARQAKTYTKLYHEEKGENNYIFLDLSSSMYFGTTYALKSVIASKAAALIAWLGYNQHNNVGSIIFNNTQTLFTPAKSTKNNITTLFNNIISLHDIRLINQQQHISSTNNLFSTLGSFENLMAKNSRIFIISDFLDANDLLYQKIQKLKFNNLIYLIRIGDEIEKTVLPAGKYNIANGEHSTVMTINKNNQELFIDFFQKKLAPYNKLITKLKINNIELISSPKWYSNLIMKLKS